MKGQNDGMTDKKAKNSPAYLRTYVRVITFSNIFVIPSYVIRHIRKNVTPKNTDTDDTLKFQKTLLRTCAHMYA